MAEQVMEKPTVLLTTHEAVSVLQGRSVTCHVLGGGEAVVRLATPGEAAELIRESRRSLGLDPNDVPGGVEFQAARITEPML